MWKCRCGAAIELQHLECIVCGEKKPLNARLSSESDSKAISNRDKGLLYFYPFNLLFGILGWFVYIYSLILRYGFWGSNPTRSEQIFGVTVWVVYIIIWITINSLIIQRYLAGNALYWLQAFLIVFIMAFLGINALWIP